MKIVYLPPIAEACDRMGVSDRGAAFISSCLLEDLGQQTHTPKSIFDKSKVRRERIKSRKTQLDQSISEQIESLYFDGKRDQTYKIEDNNGIRSKRRALEEHISVLSEPGTSYIGHFTPVNGSSKGILDGIINLCKEKL